MNRLKYYDKTLRQWVPFSASDTQTFGGKTAEDFYSDMTQQIIQKTQNIENNLSGGLSTRVDTVELQLADIAIDIKHPPIPFNNAKGDDSTLDTQAIQACMNYVESIGGGKVLVPTSTGNYMIDDTIRIGSNTTVIFQGKSYFKLATYTSVGTILFNKAGATNINIFNPLIDGNNISAGGENGISCGDCGSMHVYGGHIRNCVLNPDPPKSGGKAYQVEAYNVKDFLAVGTFIENCSVAMSSVRDMAHVGKINARFDNIHAKNCGQLTIFKQVNGKDVLGLEHEVMVTNFVAENCGGTDGVFVFSRASNCHFINGRVINSSSVDAIIRGRHNRCTFDNVDILGNCNAIIDMNPSYFGLDADIQEQNTYNIKMFGTYNYLLKSDTTGNTYINNDLKSSTIKAYLVNDATTGLVESNAKSQTTIMNLMNDLGKRIINSTTNVFFLTNKFAVAPKLKMEYHTFDNLNAGINTVIKDTNSALNVSANGLPYAARMYDTNNEYSFRFKPSQFATIETIDSSGTLSALSYKASMFDIYTTTGGMLVRDTVVAPVGDGTQSLGTVGNIWKDVQCKDGVIITAPNGSRYKLHVDNAGTIISTLL